MSLYIQNLSTEQKREIHRLLENPDPDFPAKRLYIVLRSAAGEDISTIAEAVELHPIHVRKWINRFLFSGVEGLRSVKSPGRPPLFSVEQRNSIMGIAKVNPRMLG